MSSGLESGRKWNERSSAEDPFRLYFERSPDAIWLFDPATGIFVDCNEAAARLMRCDRSDLLQMTPAGLSPELQPDGRSSQLKAEEYAEVVERHGSLRFEWLARRPDGSEVPLEVLMTAVRVGGRSLHVVVSRDITERKRTQEQVRKFQDTLQHRIEERTAELRASEEKLRTIIEHAPEAIVVLDCDLRRFVHGNENATRLFGYPRERLLQLDVEALSPSAQPNGQGSVDAAREWIGKALAGETPTFEWTHRHATGRLMTCEIRLVRLPGPGRLVRGSIIDMTERRRRERIQQATYEISEAVHATEDLGHLYARIHQVLAALMPAHNFYIALLDRETDVISFPYFVDQLASGPPEPRRITTGLTGIVLRTGRPLLIDRATSERKRQEGHSVVIDGIEVPYIESGRPAAVWLGAPLMFRGRTLGVMAVQDYQDERAYGEAEKQVLTFIAAQTALAIVRKRAEQALRESEEKFRALFEASSQGIMLHDQDRYLEVNPAAIRMFGYDNAGDLVGRHPAQTSAPIQPNGQPADVLAREYIDECLRTGRARFDWLARRADGADLPIEVILTRIYWSGREVIQAVVNDITERKQAEAELLKSLAREKELGELKSNFVSMVSHEFRTPLGIIMSSAEILRDYLDQLEPAERQRHLESVRKNTRRMADLMEEVLLLGRFDAGRMDFQPAPIDVAAFCRRVVEEVHTTVDREAPIVIEMDQGIAAAPATSDERLLHHIFLNLLLNAVKYSESAAPIAFGARRDGRDAVFKVVDHGIGIPEADREWLFNAFHRGRNVGQRPGSGLGLVIVKRCVELHRGRITVRSTVGKGTTFTVRLPFFEGQGSVGGKDAI